MEMTTEERLIVLTEDTVEGELFEAILIVPGTMDLTYQEAKYDQWYREVYCAPPLGHHGDRYRTFKEWLVEEGARAATPDEALVYTKT